MKTYLRRLRKALKGKNHYPDEEEHPLVRELDDYIVNMVRVNLKNYNSGRPANLTEEERKKRKEEMISLAEKICKGEIIRLRCGKLEEKQGYGMEDLKKDRERFQKLIGENLFYLWD